MNVGTRCAICDEDDIVPLYDTKRSPGPVVRCRQCGLVFVSPVQDQHALVCDGPVLGSANAALLTSNDLSDIAGCWELSELAKKAVECQTIRLNAYDALGTIGQFAPVPIELSVRRKLLDFGCGWGFFLAAAQERGWEVHGLEPLAGHAVYARARTGATIVTDVLRDDTFPLEFFDAITAFQVFEHLPDPAGNLGRLQRMLKPGGVILIEVPNVDTWSVRLLGPRHRHFVQDHVTFFSARTLGMLLEETGFELLSTYHPGRRMTVRYLVDVWGPRYLSQPVVAAARSILKASGLWERVITLKLGDIITAIGRKQT